VRSEHWVASLPSSKDLLCRPLDAEHARQCL